MVAQGQQRVLLFGAGSLGKAFLRRVSDLQHSVQIVGIVTGHHGQIIKPDGISASEALSALEDGEMGDQNLGDAKLALSELRPDAAVECTPQNIRSGDPSLSILRAALDQGVHAITSNPSAVALGYGDLRERAAAKRLHFGFEAAVLGGLPIFRWLRGHNFVGEVTKIRGILNGTSSLVAASVADGSTRSRGLARAQALGIAEADTVLDLDGWDAAAKAAMLGNVLCGGRLRVIDVIRKGLESIEDKEIQAAARDEKSVRLVATIEKLSEGLTVEVKPTPLKPDDLLSGLRGAATGVAITTSAGQTFCIGQGTAGLDDAALGIVSDLDVARGKTDD